MSSDRNPAYLTGPVSRCRAGAPLKNTPDFFQAVSFCGPLAAHEFLRVYFKKKGLAEAGE